MRRSILCLAVCAVLAVGAGENPAPSDERIDVGTHHLQMHREGKGAPAVVIDAGLADRMDNLRPLQQKLAEVTQVVIYNRAGYGRSEAGPSPRDAAREANELRTMLASASVPCPYVLVGHSLGALNVQVFASEYPDAVAGIVLLDPPPLSFIRGQDYTDLRTMAERMTADWQAIADSSADSADPEVQAKAAFFRMIASEHRELFGESAKLAEEISTFGDTPLVVVASGKPNPAFGPIAAEYQRYWIEQSRKLSEKSTRGRFILASESSHQLFKDAPDSVAAAILSVVREARTSAAER